MENLNIVLDFVENHWAVTGTAVALVLGLAVKVSTPEGRKVLLQAALDYLKAKTPKAPKGE